MRFDALARRLDRIRLPEVAGDDGKAAFAFMQHFPARLDGLVFSDMIGEMEAAQGPRPFEIIDEMSNRYPDLAARIKAAGVLALADALADLGESSGRIEQIRTRAWDSLSWEAKDRQTVCDQCGSDLAGWSCYSWQRDGGAMKLCRDCGGAGWHVAESLNLIGSYHHAAYQVLRGNTQRRPVSGLLLYFACNLRSSMSFSQRLLIMS